MTEENEGFFKKFHESINNELDEVTKNNFANLESNSKRVSYLCSLPIIKKYDITDDVVKCKTGGEFPVNKSLSKALQLKDAGNQWVQKGDWVKALVFYSQSMMHMPEKETEELSIVFANRSAALNHLQQYEEALADIKKCLSLGYPRHLRYKVYERKARSLLALKRNRESIVAFQDTISALDEATKLEKEKRTKMRTDAKIMLEILNKGLVLAGNPSDPEPLNKIPPKPKLAGKHNSKFPAASEAITIDTDDVKGRYATATRDISAGEVLLIEKAHSGVLLAEFSKTHCQNCFLKCPISLPCPKCPNVIFCSDKCLETALKSYHGYECQILPLIWKSGCSITCQIALRMITQNKKDYFLSISNDLKPQLGAYKTEDYRNIYNLTTHEEKRCKQDFLHRTEMVVFLIKVLELTGYFDGKPRTKPIEMVELNSMAVNEKYQGDVELIGGYLLRNLQVLQFNAHEVFELQVPKPKVDKNIIKHDGKSVFLAGAVFPTLALFNHSCEPGVVRYFYGSHIVVRAVKNIKKGEEVCENYGPIFTTVPKEKRQMELKDRYWFDCECIPCKENWPLYDEMTENYMRFKCDSDNPCPNVVAVPYDCTEFMIQCGLCQQYTNILKGLKSLQDTEMLYRLGRAAMDEGKYGEAVKKFTEVLKLYDATLAPPYKSYYDCVQDLRRCLLSMGNYSII
ncbi:SET and MYND domain-containing protein 4 isoform X1 [Bombyx mandarina]|uniref:SET and MYND domain-containing protein 4 isoform X1 n=2 Tax=Bombyx mandarina TaxID=7092 RepID=A0A6J2JX70_BOMMA|nr:SET and MYND domain-containing protein 4 isoform X1 [Bombyx mandarina]